MQTVIIGEAEVGGVLLGVIIARVTGMANGFGVGIGMILGIIVGMFILVPHFGKNEIRTHLTNP